MVRHASPGDIMRFKGTDRKAVTELVARSQVAADYARLYPDTPRRAVDLITQVSDDYEAMGMNLVIEVPDTPDARRDRLAALYGLTGAEARLALHIGDGGSLSGYATARSLSRNTARNQLQQVFDKADVRRQAELVALLKDF